MWSCHVTESHYPFSAYLAGSRIHRGEGCTSPDQKIFGAQRREDCLRDEEGKVVCQGSVPRLSLSLSLESYVPRSITPVKANGLVTSARQFFRVPLGCKRRTIRVSLSLSFPRTWHSCQSR